MRKMVNILKDGGIVIILLPNCWYVLDFVYRGLIRGYNQTHGQPLMERFYSKIDGKELLEKNGLYVLDIKKYNKFNAPIPKKWNFTPINVLLKLFWKTFRVFIPLNVSYGFCYICLKSKRDNITHF